MNQFKSKTSTPTLASLAQWCLVAAVLTASTANAEIPVTRLQGASSTYTFSVPGGDSWWSDNYANTNDGFMMTQSGLLTSGKQAVFWYDLGTEGTPHQGGKILPQNADGSWPKRLAVIASSVTNTGLTDQRHLFWGGQEQVAPNYPASTRVDIIKFSGGFFTDVDVREVASGRRILEARAASCGGANGGNERDVTIRAFGVDYGTNAAPAGATDATVFDGYWIGDNSFFSWPMSSIPGWSQVKVRGANTIPVSAGTLCIFAGGQSISTGLASNQVAMLNMSRGIAYMSWSTWNMTTARSSGAGVFLPLTNQIVIAGGILNSAGTTLTDVVDVYDLGLKQVILTTKLPTGPRFRLSGTATADGRYAIFAGGYSQLSPSAQLSNIVEVYDSLLKTWLVLTNVLSTPRAGMAVGAFKHPDYPQYSNGAYNLRVVFATGVDGSPNPSMAIDKLKTLWQKKTGSLPQTRYNGASASWPSTGSPYMGDDRNFEGRFVISGGITTGGTLRDDLIYISPQRDPTNPGNWTAQQFPNSWPTLPQLSPSRTSGFSWIYPPYTDDILIAETFMFWGGQIASNAPSARWDSWRDENVNWYAASDYVYSHYLNEASAQCYMGSFKNSYRRMAMRAFGIDAAAGGASVNTAAVHDVRWYRTLGDSWAAYNSGLNKRYDVTGLGASSFCIFAGGYDGSSLYSLINVYDVADPTTTFDGVQMGHTVPTPSSVQLSVARRFMGAAFVPRDTTTQGGYALFAGGQVSGGTATTVIDIIDTRALTTWYVSSSLTLGTARYGAAGVGIGSRYALFAGGVDSSGNPSNAVDLFDAETFTMTSLSQTLSVARSNIQAGVMMLNETTQTYVVVFAGGATSGGTPVSTIDTYTFTAAGPIW